ncbi:MAG: PIN domain-containing protein [Candidatus Heimdallarchaeota archaeon]|nr:PIN domain-containing protein [Candidatus Heimdallarchaeota archaeon]
MTAFGKKPLLPFFLENHLNEILFTTEINVFELYLGLYSSKQLNENSQLLNQRKNRLEEFLTKFQILPFSRHEAIVSAKILGQLFRVGQPVEFRDCLIAGTALANGINSIITKNVNHFQRMPGITVVLY